MHSCDLSYLVTNFSELNRTIPNITNSMVWTPSNGNWKYTNNYVECDDKGQFMINGYSQCTFEGIVIIFEL